MIVFCIICIISTTWCALIFDLTDNQLENGDFTGEVSYTLRMNPFAEIETSNSIDTDIYNDGQIPSVDNALMTGYLTMQNFVRAWIVSDNSNIDFNVTTDAQRYPPSSIYEEEAGIDVKFYRYSIWKWVAGVVIAIALLTPILSSIIVVIREREMKMTDLLQISGMLPSSYYAGNLIVILTLGSITIGIVVGMSRAFNIFSEYHVAPYSSLMALYILDMGASAFVFGFILRYCTVLLSFVCHESRIYILTK